MATDPRPYVLSRITERGTIRLLFDDQREIDLAPRDAAELAVQILKAHGLTYGIWVDTYLWDDEVHAQSVDVPTLKVEGSGRITMLIPATKATIGDRIREHTLQSVRDALGLP